MMKILKNAYHNVMNFIEIHKNINKVRFLSNVKLRNCFFEGKNSVGSNNILDEVSIGCGTYTGRDVNFVNVKIGKYCSIASNVKNVTGRHPTKVFVSTHPAFFSTSKAAGFTFATNQIFEEIKKLSSGYFVEIGNDVWIGENVTILDGIKIGNGAIVGANSLIVSDLPPYSISVGTPARVIKYRFSQSEIDLLQNYKWWDKDFEWIKNNYIEFTNIESFKKLISETDCI